MQSMLCHLGHAETHGKGLALANYTLDAYVLFSFSATNRSCGCVQSDYMHRVGVIHKIAQCLFSSVRHPFPLIANLVSDEISGSIQTFLID